MTTLVEGSLAFDFPSGWTVSKYDEWAFYRRQFGHVANGSKAVDFLCIDDGCAWLIEVKDYSLHAPTRPSELPREVATKVRDTLAGLAAAQANAADQAERDVASAALRRRWRVALHVEQPRSSSRLRPQTIDPASLAMTLRRTIKAIDAHPKVVDASSDRVPWRVSRHAPTTP